MKHGAHGVVPSAVARVRRRRRPRYGTFRKAYILSLHKLHPELLPEKCPRERVAVVEIEFVAQKIVCPPDREIRGAEMLLLGFWQLHGATYFDAPPGELASAKEDREVVSTAIQWVLLPNLHSVISKEVEYDEWPALKLRSLEVVEHSIETEHFAIPL